MSLYGLTKGTPLEEMVRCGATAEANGTAMYYALARWARELGLPEEVAQTLIKSANEEAVHAGFYTHLNGKFSQDFWTLIDSVRRGEVAGEGRVMAMAAEIRKAGLNEAADEMEIFAKQEGHHGVVLDELMKKYMPADTKINREKVYVCPVCGCEYVGDLENEPDSWTCPLCGQPKSVFQPEEKGLKVKAVKLYENGFMTRPFALGGEDGVDKFDPTVKYRSSLQNFVIDTGREVILVDTGTPESFPDQVVDDKTQIFLGKRIELYIDALKRAGYQPEQVSKILVTHKHDDHTGELAKFPNAKIYIARAEADAMKLNGDNVIRVDFTDGAYHNFPACQKIADGVYYIQAVGHTTGNSIVIAEGEGIFYLMHGDVTYTDEALYENKLSVVFEDKAAARETLDRVREFVKNNPTVYCSTHTPLGYENLEAKKIVDLSTPPKPIPPTEIAQNKATGKYVCSICGYVYDPAEHGGVAFEDLPADWKCPRCKQSKDKFNKA